MNFPTRIGAPAAPGNGATVTLFDSTAMLAGGLQQNAVRFVVVDIVNLDVASAALGIRGYESWNHGATWEEADFDVPLPVQAAIGDTLVKIFVGAAPDVKLTYTADAAGPSTWHVSIVLDSGAPVQV